VGYEDLFARLPFIGMLMATLAATWYAVYGLTRHPAAQPVAFAFGGEASPGEARAGDDAAKELTPGNAGGPAIDELVGAGRAAAILACCNWADISPSCCCIKSDRSR
jgi:hypothetical protein